MKSSVKVIEIGNYLIGPLMSEAVVMVITVVSNLPL